MTTEPTPPPAAATDQADLSWLSPNLDDAGRREIVSMMVKAGRLDPGKLPPSMVSDLRQPTKPDAADPAWSDETNTSAEFDALAEDVMRPLTEDEIDLSPTSEFAMKLPSGLDEEWNADLELKAKAWLAAAEVNAGELGGLQSAFREVVGPAWNPEKASAGAHRMLDEEFGDDKDHALNAAVKAVLDTGGEELQQFLVESGLSVHPLVVRQFVNLARRKGYI